MTQQSDEDQQHNNLREYYQKIKNILIRQYWLLY